MTASHTDRQNFHPSWYQNGDKLMFLLFFCFLQSCDCSVLTLKKKKLLFF